METAWSHDNIENKTLRLHMNFYIELEGCVLNCISTVFENPETFRKQSKFLIFWYKVDTFILQFIDIARLHTPLDYFEGMNGKLGWVLTNLKFLTKNAN